MTDTMYETKEHTGGVVSRTAEHAQVQEPVVVTLAGSETDLTLDDARDLMCGLRAAITVVEEAEARLKANSNGHSFVIGKTEYGMSFVIPSKLGNNPSAIDQARIATKAANGWPLSST